MLKSTCKIKKILQILYFKTKVYYTYIEEDYLLAKDGFDKGILLLGPFTPKKIILIGIIKDF